jgi:hypothetical protein
MIFSNTRLARQGLNINGFFGRPSRISRSRASHDSTVSADGALTSPCASSASDVLEKLPGAAPARQNSCLACHQPLGIDARPIGDLLLGFQAFVACWSSVASPFSSTPLPVLSAGSMWLTRQGGLSAAHSSFKRDVLGRWRADSQVAEVLRKLHQFISFFPCAREWRPAAANHQSFLPTSPSLASHAHLSWSR